MKTLYFLLIGSLLISPVLKGEKFYKYEDEKRSVDIDFSKNGQGQTTILSIPNLNQVLNVTKNVPHGFKVIDLVIGLYCDSDKYTEKYCTEMIQGMNQEDKEQKEKMENMLATRSKKEIEEYYKSGDRSYVRKFNFRPPNGCSRTLGISSGIDGDSKGLILIKKLIDENKMVEARLLKHITDKAVEAERVLIVGYSENDRMFVLLNVKQDRTQNKSDTQTDYLCISYDELLRKVVKTDPQGVKLAEQGTTNEVLYRYGLVSWAKKVNAKDVKMGVNNVHQITETIEFTVNCENEAQHKDLMLVSHMFRSTSQYNHLYLMYQNPPIPIGNTIKVGLGTESDGEWVLHIAAYDGGTSMWDAYNDGLKRYPNYKSKVPTVLSTPNYYEMYEHLTCTIIVKDGKWLRGPNDNTTVLLKLKKSK